MGSAARESMPLKRWNALLILACHEGRYQKKRSVNEDIARVLNISMKMIARVNKSDLQNNDLTCDTSIQSQPEAGR
jgi:hypothetical protein